MEGRYLPTFPVSSLLLGDQPSFLGLFLVDVLAVGLGRQGVAHDAQHADGGDVNRDQVTSIALRPILSP
jgi:hypothetical protein